MAEVKKSVFKTDPLTRYIEENSLRIHPVQQELIDRTMQHSMSVMIGDPICLHLIANLMRSMKAKKVLDIGVYTGCSALNAALVVPDDGEVVALDISEEWTGIGKPFWEKAGVAHKIDLKIAPALESLDALIANGESGTFDFAFVDADKVNYPNYFDRCLKLIRSGGMIVFDNSLMQGTVADPLVTCDNTVTARKVNKMLHESDKVDVSLLNIGDGLSLVFIK